MDAFLEALPPIPPELETKETLENFTFREDRDNLALVEKLLEKEDPNSKNSKGQTILHRGLDLIGLGSDQYPALDNSQCIRLIKMVCKEGGSLTQKDDLKRQPIHYAITRLLNPLIRLDASDNSGEDVVKKLLPLKQSHSKSRGTRKKISQRSPVNVHDNNNHTPLFLAVVADNIEIARFLIAECGAAPKKSGSVPPPYLLVAVQNRNKAMVELLLKSLSSLNDRKILFEKAIEKEAQDKVGEGEGYVDSYFLRHMRVQQARRDKEYLDTPLTIAVTNGDIDIVEILLKYDAEPYFNYTDGGGEIDQGHEIRVLHSWCHKDQEIFHQGVMKKINDVTVYKNAGDDFLNSTIITARYNLGDGARENEDQLRFEEFEANVEEDQMALAQRIVYETHRMDPDMERREWWEMQRRNTRNPWVDAIVTKINKDSYNVNEYINGRARGKKTTSLATIKTRSGRTLISTACNLGRLDIAVLLLKSVSLQIDTQKKMVPLISMSYGADSYIKWACDTHTQRSRGTEIVSRNVVEDLISLFHQQMPVKGVMDVMINPRLPNGDAQGWGPANYNQEERIIELINRLGSSPVSKKAENIQKVVRGHQTRSNMKTLKKKLKRSSRKKILTKKSTKKDTKSDEEAGPVTRRRSARLAKKKE